MTILDAVLPSVDASTRHRLAVHAEVVRVASGSNLVTQGASSGTLAALLSGAARTTCRTDARRPAIVLDLLRGPCLVARVPARAEAVSPYSVTAMRPCVAVRIPDATLREAAHADASLADALDDAAGQALRAMVRRVEDVAVGTVEERLARVLDDLATRYGSPVGQGRFIGLPLRRRDLAGMLAVTLETVSRLLARYEREGLVRTARDGIWWSTCRTERIPR